jgi:tetratricopeptide (TPR) repeat protein
MKSTKFEPLPLIDVIGGRYIAPVPPDDAPVRVLCELEGDAALAEKRYEDALTAYKATKAASWRLKSKMGMCCYQLDRWAEGAKLLEEAPKRRESVPLVMLIDCVTWANEWSTERNEKLRSLVRILMELPDQVPYSFELVDKHLVDIKERLPYFKRGFDLFPSDARIRRHYVRALWLSHDYQHDELMQLGRDCTAETNSAPDDLWLASEIMHNHGRHRESLDLLRRLRATSEGAADQVLSLVEADGHLLAGEYSEAADMYRTILEVCTKPEIALPELALSSARGLLKLGALANDRDEVANAAAALQKVFGRYGPLGLEHQGHPYHPQPVSLGLGAESAWYLPVVDLSELSEPLYLSIANTDLRAFFTVLHATQGDRDTEILEHDALALILSAGSESRNPLIERTVAWAKMQAEQYEAAGRAFARLEWVRSSAIPGGLGPLR